MPQPKAGYREIRVTVEQTYLIPMHTADHSEINGWTPLSRDPRRLPSRGIIENPEGGNPRMSRQIYLVIGPAENAEDGTPATAFHTDAQTLISIFEIATATLHRAQMVDGEGFRDAYALEYAETVVKALRRTLAAPYSATVRPAGVMPTPPQDGPVDGPEAAGALDWLEIKRGSDFELGRLRERLEISGRAIDRLASENATLTDRYERLREAALDRAIAIGEAVAYLHATSSAIDDGNDVRGDVDYLRGLADRLSARYEA